MIGTNKDTLHCATTKREGRLPRCPPFAVNGAIEMDVESTTLSPLNPSQCFLIVTKKYILGRVPVAWDSR
jgi:hypothetical protein